MKKTTLTILLAAAACIPAFADKGVAIAKTNGETLHLANSAIRSMTFADNDAIFTSTTDENLTISRDEILSITPVEEVATAYSVTFAATKASVVNPYGFQGVSTEIDGAYVTTTNTNLATELTFDLEGSTADGSFTYYGDYKCTLRFNGVDITSQRGAAVDVKCGKRIAVVLTEGTVNNLSDYESGEQKAALYFKGHPEFEKGGTLNVTGRCNHAISSKEYMQFKKTVGSVNILSAANDGIHAGQYFQINGGTVNISNVAGDGIQAEITDDETDELNGQMIIKGGALKISVSGSTADCLKADDLITISGGTLDLTATGNGIQDTTAAPAFFGPGGTGGGNWGGGSSIETSSPKCINGGGAIAITGGSITTLSTGKGGKGIVCDGILTIGGEDMNPEISCSTTGACVSGSGDNASGLPKAIKAEGDIVINSGDIRCKTSQNGGEGIESKSTITINGGTVVCNTYDDGINATSKITVNGGVVWSWATNNDGMDCNGSQGFEFNGGIVVSNGTSGIEEGFDCDNYKFAINGGIVLGVGGSSSSVTSATQPYAQTSSVTVSKDKYLSMVNADGTVLFSYLCPTSLSATVVSSSPGYAKGSSCKLVYGVTAVNNPTESYLDGRMLIGGTLTGGSSKSITPNTK